MISLDKYTYFMITAKMYMLGFTIYKEIHPEEEIWINSRTQSSFKIKNKSGSFSKKELLDILKEADVDINKFIEV